MAQMPRDGLVNAAFAFHDGDGEQWTFSIARSESFRADLRPRGARGNSGRGPGGWLRVDGGVTPGQRIGGPVKGEGQLARKAPAGFFPTRAGDGLVNLQCPGRGGPFVGCAKRKVMADAVVLDSRGQLVGRTRPRRTGVFAAQHAELPIADLSLRQEFGWRGSRRQGSPDCPGRVGAERGLPAFGEDGLVDGPGFHGGFNSAGGTQGKGAPHAMVLDFHGPALDGAKLVAAGVRVLEESPAPKAC